MLTVQTSTGVLLPVTLWTDKNTHVRFFPLRIGYASTVHKAQGGEYKHVTIWMNAKHMPAAGYTALSRVKTCDDYLLAGFHLERMHFVPATFTHSGQYRG